MAHVRTLRTVKTKALRLNLTCQHCKHSWVPRGGGRAPRRCPGCGNNWRGPYKYRTEKAEKAKGVEV